MPSSAAGTSGSWRPTTALGDGTRFGSICLQLTGAGERVLRGEADRVELLGLDRWLGGTHLTAENAWRWDSHGRRLVAPT